MNLPKSRPVERGILGACLLQPAHITLCESLPDDAFFLTENAHVMEALRAVDKTDRPVNALSVGQWLDAHYPTEWNYAQLAGLYDGIPQSVNVDQMITELLDIAARRRLIAVATKSVGDIAAAETAATAATTMIEELRDAAAGLETGSTPIGDHMEPALDPPPAGSVIMTGWEKLDSLGAVPRRGELLAACARPGHGKTAAALVIAARACADGMRVGFMSLEMSGAALFQRLLAARSDFPLAAIRDGGALSMTDVCEVAWEIHDWPIDLVRGRGVDDLRRHVIRQPDTGLVIVDYLQLMHAPAASRKYGSRVAEISAISAGMRELAADTNVGVLVLAQMNREVEKRGDGSPRLSDLRESGAIEQDADVVWGLYRPALSPIPEKADAADKNRLTLRVLKHRNGPTGHVHLHFNLVTQAISQAADQSDQPEPPGL